LLLCLTLAASALAADDPDSRFHKLIGRYIEEARSNYGSTNGLLASDLLLLLKNDLRRNVAANREREVIANVKELLDIYPKMPSENQRYLAVQAIDLGYRLIDGRSLSDANLHPKFAGRHGFTYTHTDTPEVADPPPFVDPVLGRKIIASVVKAAAKNRWPDDKLLHKTWFGISLNEALAKVAGDGKIDHRVRTQAQYALATQKVSQAPLVEPIVADLEALLKADWPPKQRQEKPVDWARYQLSWAKDSPWAYCKSITTYTFPEVESLKIQNYLDALIELYPTLSEADQYSFCARLMDLTEKLIRTDVHKPADILFWKVFSSIKIGWLDSGQISGGLLGNHTHYFQSCDLQSARKIMTKVIAFESAGNPNFASDINRRTSLADTCDMMGDYTEAKKQLQIITQLNEKMYANGLSDHVFYNMTRAAVVERSSANQ